MPGVLCSMSARTGKSGGSDCQCASPHAAQATATRCTSGGHHAGASFLQRRPPIQMTTRTPASPAATSASRKAPTPSASQGPRPPSAVASAQSGSWRIRAWPPPGSGAATAMRAPRVPSRKAQVSAQGDQPPEPSSRSTSACSPGPSTRRSPSCRGSADGPSAHSTPTDAVARGPLSACSPLSRRVAPRSNAGCAPRLTRARATWAAAAKLWSSAPEPKLQPSASVGAKPAPWPTSSRRRSSRSGRSAGSSAASASEPRWGK
mmetsp:Transcript_69677/g.203932  ORF Transcript_69677/g.203932 Transcript_69677/m.203932 type:complete len:262 (+) Transcript_69677:253-1038(+)